MLGLGMPEWQVTALLELQQHYKQGGGAKRMACYRPWSDAIRCRSIN